MFFKTWRSGVLILGETTLLLTAVAAATYVRLGDYGWDLLWTGDGFLKILLIVGVCQICLHYADLYDLRGIVGQERDPRLSRPVTNSKRHITRHSPSTW